jgi:hypothetical protein
MVMIAEGYDPYIHPENQLSSHNFTHDKHIPIASIKNPMWRFFSLSTIGG